MNIEESTSVEEIVPITAPAVFSSTERAVREMSVGASLTGVTSKEKVAESEPPFPSVTVKTNVPISSDSLFTFAFAQTDNHYFATLLLK